MPIAKYAETMQNRFRRDKEIDIRRTQNLCVYHHLHRRRAYWSCTCKLFYFVILLSEDALRWGEPKNPSGPLPKNYSMLDCREWLGVRKTSRGVWISSQGTQSCTDCTGSGLPEALNEARQAKLRFCLSTNLQSTAIAVARDRIDDPKTRAIHEWSIAITTSNRFYPWREDLVYVMFRAFASN